MDFIVLIAKNPGIAQRQAKLGLQKEMKRMRVTNLSELTL
jgi:hypothetical protein